EQFFAAGIRDILYAVGIVPSKLDQVLALRRAGCSLKLITDNVDAAQAGARYGAEHGDRFEVWIEIDCDGHRSGVPADSDLLLDVGRALSAPGAYVGGVMTHAGSSYDLDQAEALAALAEQERAACVRAAQRLRTAGI